MRTAEGLGVDKVIISGYTPRYDDAQALPHLRAKLNRQIEKSALGAEKMVAQESVEDLPTWLERKKAEGWDVVGLENNLAPEEAARRVTLGTESLGEKVALVLGEEVAGIPTEVREKCGQFLEIPMVGRKESFNVSVAAGMALWSLLKAELNGEQSKAV